MILRNRNDRRSVESFVTTIVVVLSIVLVGAVACRHARSEPHLPSVQEYWAKSHIAKLDQLKIGVQTDQPLMGYWVGNRYTGFDIEVAKKLAELLGFGHEGGFRFVPVRIPDRDTALIAGTVDLIVASYSITKEREARGIRFAGPYLITTQEVLIPTRFEGKIEKLADLGPKHPVCVVGGSTAAAHLKEEGIPYESRNTEQQCIDGMLNDEYHAMSADETILAGFAYVHRNKFTIVDVPIGEPERLGIGVRGDDEYLQALINHHLAESYEKQTGSWWRSAFDNTLGNASVTLSEYAQQQPRPDVKIRLIDHGDKVTPKPGAARPIGPAAAGTGFRRGRRRGTHV